MSEAVIEVRNLTKTYRVGDIDVQALRGVDLRIDRGEFVAIMGSSGCGKSTLMNIMGCLDTPTSGEYSLSGQDITRQDEPSLAMIRSRRIGFVFQSFNLLPRTSALDNVALPLLYAGRGDESTARAQAVLRTLGLGGLEQNHPSQLSGGQQQRVAIARGLVNDPVILLADEPTGNLDSKAATDIVTTIRKLNREQGLTVVMVTHEPDMAAFADRVITMRDGVIIADERRCERSEPVTAAALDSPAIPTENQPVPLDTWMLFSLLAMALRVAVQAVARNKLRSALTMLGIFVGVAALITMVAVGQGANAAVKAQIEGLGTNLLIILPGATKTGGVRGGSGSASTLTVADADAIQRQASAVANVSYLITQQAQAQYADKNWSTSVQGASPSYFTIRNWPVVIGRNMTEADERDGSRVCLIGQTVYQNLYPPYENPVGTTILVKNVPLRVIGLLAPRGQTGFGRDQDDVIYMPFTTAQNKVLGAAAPTQTQSTANSIYVTPPNPFGIEPRLIGYVNIIFVQARNTALVPVAKDQITRILNRRHRIEAGATEDFSVRNISDITQAMEGSGRTIALLLALVASISLIVGGIGIMNILLVSVTERTREIGLRMALGARRLHVLLQFLVEAVLLSGIGGMAGVVMGIALSETVSLLAGWPTVISPLSVVGGFAFSAIVGIFFGYYPARRASLFNPIEALRYE
ncbi:MAG: ABC transporter permease [Salinisphaera sp.]|uniref:ABC transporter permease n=1 Tax=Salinisphaera sp. TaxID=1914330 RepID=UPI003C7E80A3